MWDQLFCARTLSWRAHLNTCINRRSSRLSLLWPQSVPNHCVSSLLPLCRAANSRTVGPVTLYLVKLPARDDTTNWQYMNFPMGKMRLNQRRQKFVSALRQKLARSPALMNNESVFRPRSSDRLDSRNYVQAITTWCTWWHRRFTIRCTILEHVRSFTVEGSQLLHNLHFPPGTLKGSDDGIWHSGLLGFWTLSIVRSYQVVEWRLVIYSYFNPFVTSSEVLIQGFSAEQSIWTLNWVNRTMDKVQKLSSPELLEWSKQGGWDGPGM
jgi:hypothetical protein